MEFLEKIYWNNTVLDYIVFLGVLLLGAVIIFLLGRTVLRRIVSYTERTQSPYGELVRAGVKHYLLPMAYFTLFYYCTRTLKLNTTLDNFVGALSTLFAIIMVYFVLTSDYDRYMDINQRVNLAIKEEFERLGVKFAFPTSVVQMQQGSSLYSQE